MATGPLTHTLLMRGSERRVEEAAESEDPRESLAAGRLLADRNALQLWENEHARYMRTIAHERRRLAQLAVLRSISFGFIHRQALFNYLRTEAARGEHRRRVVSLFHGSRAYSDAVITEHHTFIRSTCSHLCANYIGARLLGEPDFEAAFQEYERLFGEYFRLFCGARSADPEAADPCQLLLPYLKHEVNEQRRLIIGGGAALAASVRARQQLVQATGETVRLRALG
jgi:hypothetical protein